MTPSAAGWRHRTVHDACFGLIVMLVTLLMLGSPLWAARRWFKSPEGGYQVSIPKEWHVKEILAKGSYQAALSREKVEKQGDLYHYGISVVRLRDWRSVFTFTSTDPSEMALEYANRVAAQTEEKGQSLVIALPGPVRGVQSSLFHIIKYGGTDDCLSMRLVVVPSRTEWFHALWEIPCKEEEAHESEIGVMIQDLVVLPKWAK